MKEKNISCIPLKILEEMREEYRMFFSLAKEYREEEIETWSSYCYLPMAIATTYLKHMGKIKFELPALLTAIFSWRIGKGIFKYDPIFLEELLKTKELKRLPSDVLLQLPEWCCYISFSDFPNEIKEKNKISEYDGMFVFIEDDSRFKDLELRITLVNDTEKLPMFLPLIEGTIEEAVEKIEMGYIFTQKTFKKEKVEFVKFITFLIQLVLAICEKENIDIRLVTPTKKPQLKNATAERPQKWLVGERIGSSIKKIKLIYEAEGNRSSSTSNKIRPHLRNAHWHSYYVGSKEEKKKILRWVSPITINKDLLDEEDLPVVVHEVEM